MAHFSAKVNEVPGDELQLYLECPREMHGIFCTIPNCVHVRRMLEVREEGMLGRFLLGT